MRLRWVSILAVLSSAIVLQSVGCSDDSTLVANPFDGGSPAPVDAGRPAPVDAGPPVDGGSAIKPGSKATFAVLETTDLHTNVRSYDYFKLAEDKSIGLERTATLIKQARKEFPDSILVDNGDTIQGTVLADHQAVVTPIPCNQPLAQHKAMNNLAFDVGGVGNHEFNYGLGYLSQVTHTPFDVEGVTTSGNASCAGPAFPVVLSNVFSTKTNQPIFPPSAIVEKTITATDPDGKPVQTKLKVGFLAFTPPHILNWDKRWLEGKVYTKGVQEVAPPIVQDLRSKGADIVVAIIHGGISAYTDTSKTPPAPTPVPYSADLESQAYYLAQVPGIDAMLMGHSHQVFPDKASTTPGFNVPNVDKDKGLVHGVPSVMANFWGQHLGVIRLPLAFDGKHWSATKAEAVVEARPIATTCMGGKAVACDADGKWRTGAVCAFATACTGVADKTKVFIDADSSIATSVESEHQATITYVKTPIGDSDFDMSTYFAEVGDVTAIQVVNEAQTEYVSDYVKANLPQYASLPVLSVSAPFKSGFQGGNDYTDVHSGKLAINNAADLYLYPNTVYAVKVTGKTIQDWLEVAATRFKTISLTSTADQELINNSQPGYNFDAFSSPDVAYEIDVTQEPKKGRIKNLTYKGTPVDPAKEYIVATNNYRATGGGNFPGLDGSKTIFASPDTNRDVLIEYIKKKKNLTRVANGSARSWKFTKVVTAGKVLLHSARGKIALAQAAGINNVTVLAEDDGSGKGLSLYGVDLNNP
ncbi:5'-nucleotidase C-terminal domain-containing protein [Pendulispora albinea]|uniref:5'-nucleotidase C-terminal domain-containing protein n=1 Tax=Pendulispora albinea TaxID=2741071 RepID=A0ABZ2M0A7_9BACT